MKNNCYRYLYRIVEVLLILSITAGIIAIGFHSHDNAEMVGLLSPLMVALVLMWFISLPLLIIYVASFFCSIPPSSIYKKAVLLLHILNVALWFLFYFLLPKPAPCDAALMVNHFKTHHDNMYDLRRRVGIVFQNPDNQFIGSTVADDIAFGLENHCVPNEQMQPIIEKVAKSVGMENYLEKEPTHLSGGQKQRVAIAGVLAMEPDIVIFDESTSMLDPQGKATINEQIRSLHAEKEMTVVSITHDMEEVAQSEYVLVLSKGKIVMRGTPQEVFEHADQLKELRLDVPFATQVAKALKQEGIQMEESLNIEQVVNQLCQLKSNT